MVPAESSPLLLRGGGGSGGHRHVCGGRLGGLSGGFSESFSFMRLLQQVHDFSAVSEEEDDDAYLGSDRNNKDNKVNKNQDCRRDINNNLMADQEEPRTSGSSPKDNNTNTNNKADTDLNQAELREEGWLRLGIGGQTEAKTDEKTNLDGHPHDNQVDPTARRSDSSLELNLFLGGSSRFPNQEELRPPLSLANTSFGPSLLYNYQESSSSSAMKFPGHEEMIGSWAFRPPFVPQNLSSSSSSLMPLMGPYFARSQFQSQLIGSSNYTDATAAGSSSSFRVVDPPRRPHSGVWFVLQASQNQAREPFLPQIPKSYLRIKDGRMTVRLLIKYLVNKLQLEHESEIEIKCRGQELQPALTLQHVRDTIWRRRDNTSHPHLTLLPNSSTSDHLMVLHYGRSLL